MYNIYRLNYKRRIDIAYVSPYTIHTISMPSHKYGDITMTSFIINVLIILGICILLTGLYIFLIAPRMFKKPSATPFMNHHYAHRGLFNNETNAPENSLAAFKLAVCNGYGIEFDIQLTKDNIPVVFHDATLKRMCGISGKVRDYTLSELKQLKLADSNETIPALNEAGTDINGQVPLIIEYKLYDTSAKVCELSSHILSSYKGIYCIESFHPLALMWYKKNEPHIMRGQLCMKFWKEPAYKGQLIYLLLSNLVSNVVTRPDFIAYKHSDATNISRRICAKLGALSVAWTIKSPKEFDFAKKHFDLFIFDSFRL